MALNDVLRTTGFTTSTVAIKRVGEIDRQADRQRREREKGEKGDIIILARGREAHDRDSDTESKTEWWMGHLLVLL